MRGEGKVCIVAASDSSGKYCDQNLRRRKKRLLLATLKTIKNRKILCGTRCLLIALK